MIEITNENFETEVIGSDKPILVDFWAPWCGPCKMLSPTVDKIEEENPQIKVGKVNIDEQLSLAMNLGVAGVPSLLFFKDGKLVNRSLGVQSKEEIEKMIKE